MTVETLLFGSKGCMILSFLPIALQGQPEIHRVFLDILFNNGFAERSEFFRNDGHDTEW